jgi:hypothetical protein
LFADVVLFLHFAFLGFVVLGGLLVLRWPRVAWIHAPMAAWGVVVEYAGLVCPLTPLENALRLRAGETGYTGGFIEHYLTAVLYPTGLTRGFQLLLGSLLLIVNVAIYWRVLARRRMGGTPGTDM